MFQFFYHLVWLLALILLSPVYMYRLLFKGKYRSSTLARLGIQSIPDLSDKNVIWLHAVSLGEAQIAGQFAREVKASHAHAYIVASSCTETGQAVLHDSEHIDFCFYYPVDLWLWVRHLFTRLKPKAIFIMETDLWPNMLGIAVNKSTPVSVVNAKISESSFIRYQRLPFVKNRLIDSLEYLFVQCKTYQERFQALGVNESRMEISGNLKLDRSYPQKSDDDLAAFAKACGLDNTKATLIFASTHEGEEQGFIEIYLELKKENPSLQCILVPRHPERFKRVEKILNDKGIEFENYSLQRKRPKSCSFLLVDAMGVLMDMYAIADVAIVAGSFTSKVGGHNLFEPAFFAKPIVYGPWIFKQPGFHDLLQERRAAIQITQEAWQIPLQQSLKSLLDNNEKREALGQAGKAIVNESQGIGKSIIGRLEHKNILGV